MICKKCHADKAPTEFYAGDSTCKVCRCALVRANRAAKADQYKAYERLRANLPHRVKARQKYAQTAQGKASHNRAVQSANKKMPDRRAARIAVGNAVRDGRLQRWPCEICGNKAHAHHPHYGAPLLVTWLCPSHHKAAHLLIESKP
jgi:hypothetical protein